MVRVLYVVLVALVVVALAGPAQAQPQVIRTPAMGGYGGYSSPLSLLRMAQVQEELELVDEQKAKIKEIGDELRKQIREQWAGVRDLTPEERRKKYAESREKAPERAKETRQKIEKVLLPHQIKRLDQIAVQLRMRSRGVNGALGNSELAKQLGLSDDQKEQLKKIATEAQEKLRNVPREIREEAKKKAMEVLTPEQKEKLKNAAGEDFELKSRWSGAGGGARMMVPKGEVKRLNLKKAKIRKIER